MDHGWRLERDPSNQDEESATTGDVMWTDTRRGRRVRLGAASMSSPVDGTGRTSRAGGIESSCLWHVKTAAKAAPVSPGLDPARRTRAAGVRGRVRPWAEARVRSDGGVGGTTRQSGGASKQRAQGLLGASFLLF